MNPELPSPQSTPEQTPANYEHSQEFGQNLPNPEKVGERSPEREQNMRSIDRAPAFPQPPVITPLQQPQAVQSLQQAQPATNVTNPAIAGDDDLIEKEWVDKAKKIILETKDDPYKREQEVNRLQADYLFKRYGKELGTPN
jgi:hypothetical protein